MQRVGMELIAQKKASLLQHASSPDAHDVEKSSVSRRDLQDRDLLTVLLKANMATDIPDNQRLSDEDVLARESSR